MNKIKSKPGLLAFFVACPQPVRAYFVHVPRLIEEFPLDVALAYVFSQLEMAQNMAIYCGATKLHRCDSALTWRAVTSHRMTRADFREKFELIYGKAIPDAISKLVVTAEAVRDRVMHGKTTTDDDKRNAIAHALQYATDLNDFVASVGGPRPFANDLRGFKGSAKSLPPSTTRWILKGMGFGV